jgi:NADH:ubiquinone oxidoreductase subunit 4 (subunit M)
MVNLDCVVFLVVELKNSLQLFSIVPMIAGASCVAVLGLGLGDHVWSWGYLLDYFKSSLLSVIVSLGVVLGLLTFSTCYRAGAAAGGSPVLGQLGVGLEANLLSLSFALLIGLLFPCVIVLSDFDFSVHRYKYLVYMLWIYATSCTLMFSADVCVFYVVYEFLIGLVFLVMYSTANSRGGVEAILFFAGWAIVGSFLVGVAMIYMVCCCQACGFDSVAAFHFSSDELYYLYVLLFFGFGTKLSTWPLWYWLPRAHVEVSTGMSVFLSCILIKVCLYALVRFLALLHGDLVVVPFIFMVCVSVFDLTLRLAIQTDLKAITAYGSVLHVNLLLLLVLLDTSVLSTGVLLYV